MTNAPTWDYEGYWNTVLGSNRTADDVVRDFCITDTDGLDEWLGQAESDAASAGGIEYPAVWDNFHDRAFMALTDAIRANIGAVKEHIRVITGCVVTEQWGSLWAYPCEEFAPSIESLDLPDGWAASYTGLRRTVEGTTEVELSVSPSHRFL